MPQDRPMSEAERRASMTQAIANASIDGFEPDIEFLQLAEEVVTNNLTHEEAVAKILAQAQAEDKAAKGR